MMLSYPNTCAPQTVDELRGYVCDALDRHGLSASQTAELIKSRANGSSSDRLLVAAVVVLHDQAEQIRKLKVRIAELAHRNGQLENEVADLNRWRSW